MKPAVRLRAGLAVALLLAAVAQSLWASALQVHGARPDFLTAVALLGALFCEANSAAATGFVAGLLSASLSAPPHGGFGSIIVSRTLVCFGAGWLEERIFRDNPVVALAIVCLGTLAAELLFFVFAPQPQALHWARYALGSVLYNTAIALPLYGVMRRLVGQRRSASSS